MRWGTIIVTIIAFSPYCAVGRSEPGEDRIACKGRGSVISHVCALIFVVILR